MSLSIADRIRRSQNMLAGIAANGERLAKRGLDTQFLTDYHQQFTSAVDLDNEHEAAKARMKEKTAVFRAELTKTDAYYSEARKLVKLEIPQDSWQEFGIDDIR